MPIPELIAHHHLMEAVAIVERDGIPHSRESVKFDAYVNGKRYPPKYLISIAGQLAIGTRLDPYTFGGGDEANSFLRSRGIPVIPRKGGDWTSEECYMAVWGYDQIDIDRNLVKTELFREIAALVGRSDKAVEFKLQNISALDPRPWKAKPVGEAAHKQNEPLRSIFREYWKDRDAGRSQYEAYRAYFEFGFGSVEPPANQPRPNVSKDILVEEARASDQMVKRRSRSKKLLDAGRKYFRDIDPDGHLVCQACGFYTPSGIAIEIVQLHHTEPIAAAALEGRRTTLEQAIQKLLPLCPRCHVIAHTSQPPLDAAGIKQLLGL